jgi:hypothetical protein
VSAGPRPSERNLNLASVVGIDLAWCPLDILFGAVANASSKPVEIGDYLIDGRRSIVLLEPRPERCPNYRIEFVSLGPGG